MLKFFIRVKNTANSTAIIAEQRLDRLKTSLHDLYLASEDDVPRASLHIRTLTIHMHKYLSRHCYTCSGLSSLAQLDSGCVCGCSCAVMSTYKY